ncbi:hypothetical protein [Sphaerisporangium sp. NPDC051011]|uniref:hypothetical protein n=1 Tax=Sphaerisporangium sp. NPDC051011 TaxID=3155792 RepID=UPI0033C775B7
MVIRQELSAEQQKLAEAVTAALQDADRNIRAAIRAAATGGVSANEIARRADHKVSGVRGYSRPVVLEVIGAEDIRATAIAALEDLHIRVGSRYDDDVDVEVWEGTSRSVWICLSEALKARSFITRGNLAINAERALQAAGLDLCQGDLVHDMAASLRDGQTVEIYKP